MSNQDNGAVRVTPEQKLRKQVHEMELLYLSTGGETAFLLGMHNQLDIFWEAIDRLNAQRQAEQLLQARSDMPKVPAR